MINILFVPLALSSIITPSQSHIGGYWYGIPKIQYLIPHQWVKLEARWETTQPNPWIYDWSYLDQAVKVSREQNNGFVLINIHNTPSWARTSSYKCHLPDDLGFLKQFTQEIINRYHPEAISIWNEPEMDKETSASLQFCCGCLNPHEYRNALNYLYKNVNFGNSQFVIGEFLVDTDWIDQFFSGNVQADALAFHHYNYGYDTNPQRLIITQGYFKSKTTLPLWLTETSLLCDVGCGDLFRQYQALWMKEVVKHNFPLVFWFSQNNVGWRNCNMVNEYANLKYPVWYTFKEQIEYQWWNNEEFK